MPKFDLITDTPQLLALALLLPLAAVITYYDVRYRRIPNVIVLATLLAGLTINIALSQTTGLLASLGGLALAFGLMLVPHVFGTMGAGDVKLFAAIGAVIGSRMVFPAFFVVVLVGALLAVYTMVRSRTVRKTMTGVFQIFVSMFFNLGMPRFEKPEVRQAHSIPYGVAITFGSLLTVAFLRP